MVEARTADDLPGGSVCSVADPGGDDALPGWLPAQPSAGSRLVVGPAAEGAS